METEVKKLFLAACLCCIFLTMSAQDESPKLERPYNLALGLKLGNLFQLDYKHFVTPDIAVGVSSGFYLIDWPGIFSSIIVSSHHNTKVENLYWYYGGGIAGRYFKNQSQIGMATAVGLEAVSSDKVFNFFVDFQPTGYAKASLFTATPGIGFSRTISLDFTVASTFGVRYIFR